MAMRTRGPPRELPDIDKRDNDPGREFPWQAHPAGRATGRPPESRHARHRPGGRLHRGGPPVAGLASADVSTTDANAARAVRQQRWTFLTNHGAVLLEIAEHPADRLNDIADRVGISRRAAQMIVADLVEAGYVQRERIGRRNRYSVDRTRPLRHRTLGARSTVADLLGILEGSATA